MTGSFIYDPKQVYQEWVTNGGGFAEQAIRCLNFIFYNTGITHTHENQMETSGS